MKISQLIKELQKAKKEYGDVEVYAGGADYPEEVDSVSYQQRGDGYIPSNTVYLQ